MSQQPQPHKVNIKVDDQVMKGVYSNALSASHTKEEFILDFLSIFGPQGIEVAKIFVSPGNFKRFAAAINDNLKKYEDKFGAIDSGAPAGEQGTTSETPKFGF